MTNSKFKFLFIAIFAIGLTLTSCGNRSNKPTKTEQADKQGKEYTSAFICPMHCEGSGSDEAGKCPVCGMDYEKNEKHKADGHKHDNHEGHNH